jgi:hypothetical protein
VHRRIRISTKLAAALAVPLVAFLAMATFEVSSARQAASTGHEQTALATGAVGPGSLVTHLQNERNRAAIDLIGLGGATQLAVESNAEARQLVDDAAMEFTRHVDGHGVVVQATFRAAFDELAALDDLRADVDGHDGPTDISNTDFADEVFTRYTTIIEAFFDATSSAALDVDDATLRGGVVLVDAATRQAEMRARLVRDIVLLNLTGQADSVQGRQEVAALYDRSQRFDEVIATHATGPYAGIADETFADDGVQSFNRQVVRFLEGGDVNVTRLLASVRATPDSGYHGLRNRAADELRQVASGIREDAQQRRNAILAAALFACAAALGVTWTASRSITEPLRSLTEQAEEMAGSSLPAAVQRILDTPAGQDVSIPEITPIRIRTRDEVREVATALNDVQRSALDLAVEQAVLRRNIADSFVNLGRRNQNLLNRQLEVITDLEREETDPDALDGLFRLDHLATRMRRNAESLLVLAGVDPPRQWTAPVAVSDIVRAALGEVEDYQRVVVGHLEPVTVVGSAAADIAHVVAELVENALMFSPPEVPVEVEGSLTDEGYTIVIADHGMGMTEDEVAQANRRLSGAESFTVAPSRYLGHYVAGHLATRIGLGVELARQEQSGIVARVDLPSSLLPSVDPSAEPEGIGGDPLALTGPLPELAAPAETAGAPRSAEVAEPGEVVVAGVENGQAASAVEGRAGEEELSGASPFVPSEPSQTSNGLPRRTPGAQLTGGPLPGIPLVTPAGSGGSDPQGLLGDEPDFLHELRHLETPAATDPTGHGTVESPPPPGIVVSGGLTRRVPGAQRPDVSMQPLVPGPDATPARRAGDAPDGPPAESPSNAGDVYDFLSSFRSGVERGLAAARDRGTDAP